MAYATQQDMTDRYGEDQLVAVTDRSGEGVIDVDVLARALNDASSEIDAYLAGRYVLPLSAVPLVLGRLAAEIAWYRLHPRDNVIARERYEDAMRFLRDVAAGKANLDIDAQDAPAAQVDGPMVSAPDRLFTMTTLKDF